MSQMTTRSKAKTAKKAEENKGQQQMATNEPTNAVDKTTISDTTAMQALDEELAEARRAEREEIAAQKAAKDKAAATELAAKKKELAALKSRRRKRQREADAEAKMQDIRDCHASKRAKINVPHSAKNENLKKDKNDEDIVREAGGAIVNLDASSDDQGDLDQQNDDGKEQKEKPPTRGVSLALEIAKQTIASKEAMMSEMLGAMVAQQSSSGITRLPANMSIARPKRGAWRERVPEQPWEVVRRRILADPCGVAATLVNQHYMPNSTELTIFTGADSVSWLCPGVFATLLSHFQREFGHWIQRHGGTEAEAAMVSENALEFVMEAAKDAMEFSPANVYAVVKRIMYDVNVSEEGDMTVLDIQRMYGLRKGGFLNDKNIILLKAASKGSDNASNRYSEKYRSKSKGRSKVRGGGRKKSPCYDYNDGNCNRANCHFGHFCFEKDTGKGCGKGHPFKDCKE